MIGTNLRSVAVFTFVILAACTSTSTQSPPPTEEGAVLLEGTVGLPPAYTPTPVPTPIPTLPPTQKAEVYDPLRALRPEFAGDAQLFPSATRYSIDFEIDLNLEEQSARLEGLVRIQYTNPLDVPLPDIVLMLWPNDEQYQSTMVAGPVLIEGQPVRTTLLLDGLAMKMDLPIPLAPGQAIDLSLPFRVDASAMTPAAPRRLGITQGVLIAPTFYPLVPRLIDGVWEVEAAPPGGDTTNSDIAFYHVRTHAPSEFKLVASGIEATTDVDEGGDQEIVFVTGPVRDFALALGPFELETRTVDGVTLKAWVLPEHLEDMEVILDSAEIQMSVLTDRVGPYPYTELDLVDAPGAFGGIEYPGLVFIGTVGTPGVIDPTVHEVAHQWFYGLIGDDQIHEPWLDEAAATYAQVLYYEEAEGAGRATSFISGIQVLLREVSDSTIPIGLGVGDYASVDDYGMIVYYKGALFFDALRRELGDRTFFDFLETYFDRHRYEIASSQDFKAAAESTCECDLTAMFDLWVYQGGEIPGP